MLTQQLHNYVAQLKQTGLHRKRQVFEKNVLSFSSNDYLSLTNHPKVKQAYQTAFVTNPVGGGGSMVVCGYHEAHRALEKAFANALQVDDCLVFSSGFAANLCLVNLFKRLNAPILMDKEVHASIYEGIALSEADYVRYHPHDLTDAAAKMSQMPEQSVVLTESIFSMSGDKTPLKVLNQLVKSHSLKLFVDEAHAFGVVGPEGLGSVKEAQLSQVDVPLRVIPFGKGMGAHGAIVAGLGLWIDALLQSARPFIYSTALSPAFAHGLLETLTILRASDDRRAKLSFLVQYFRQAIQQSPLTWRDSETPIQQLQLGCPLRALSYASRLQEHGILCLPMRQPTVTKKETGLRIILNYDHQPEDIDKLFQCLHEN